MVYSGLLQIFSGILGGFIAIIGVVWTLQKQREQSNEEWKRQYDLSMTEWKRQDERYIDDWRINVQPWFELQEREQGVFLYMDKFEEDGMQRKYENDTDFSISFERFTLVNTGKDFGFVEGVFIKSTTGSCMISSREKKRITVGNSIVINLYITKLYFKKDEEFSVYIIYSDMFKNLYAAKLSIGISNTVSYFIEEVNGIKHNCFIYKANAIELPRCIKTMSEI